MLPDVLNTVIAAGLVCCAVLDLDLVQAHGFWLALAGGAMAALGIWANRVDYLKWAGATAALAGIAVVATVVTGFDVSSADVAFWVALWSGTAAGIVSLWSALYRGPSLSAAAD